jgi:ABC-type Fe3+/spermidine/putrescine transport system ATPase subunit
MGLLKSSVYPESLPGAGNVTCSIRPETIRFLVGDPAHGEAGLNHFEAMRADTIYLGELAQYRLQLKDGSTLKAFELNPHLLDEPGQDVTAAVAADDVVILGD